MIIFLQLCILATLVYIAWLLGKILPGIASILAGERRAQTDESPSADVGSGETPEELPSNTWRLPRDTEAAE
jgi:hypothetical protein